uniref:Transposase IS4-like domain-containing protein n=1 Tax=Candidatus Nitrotoga fabula TaxID=2182327 RepID=A0A2X0QVE5_9PROT|nr:protein of unknown function [Candidatus Nitrotoga fabula]
MQLLVERVIVSPNHIELQLRANVEHAFRVLKCQFGFTKVRYRGLEKNANHLFAAFARVNIAGVMRLRQAGRPGNCRSSEKIPHWACLNYGISSI